MWPFRKAEPTCDSESVTAAQKSAEHARTVLREAQKRSVVVDAVSTRSNELRKRNHFGEAIDACMERK